MHCILHILAANSVMDQLRQFAHSSLVHAEACHLGNTDTQAGRIAWVGVAGEHIVVDDDIVGFQALGNFDASSPLSDIHGNHMALCIAELAGLYRGTEFIEAMTECLSIAHDLSGILA